MNEESLSRLKTAIRDVQDFPKKGVVFKDITPVLLDGELFRLAVDAFIEQIGDEKPDKIVGIDARGFIFGAAIADRLGVGFVPVRKQGKLPWHVRGASYALEYGEARAEIHEDAISPGEKVVLVDDLLATGGTAGATLRLIRELGGEVLCFIVLIELTFLQGRGDLENESRVVSILTY